MPLKDDTASRLAFVAHWLLIPALTLLAGIMAIANQRFFTPDAIDGSPDTQSWFIQITLRYNLNTLEQTVLAAAAWTGLSLSLPHAQLKLIPTIACVFLVGRVLFWIGYLVMPVLRAFGLGLTAYPTFAALIWLAVRMVVG